MGKYVAVFFTCIHNFATYHNIVASVLVFEATKQATVELKEDISVDM